MNVEQWLGQDNKLGQDIWYKKYCYQNETFEQWIERVSGGDRDLGDLIRSRKFLFGGRALANRNTDRPGSMFNCYSSGYVGDSVQEIMELNTNLALTYKAQGGQGVSLSKIRPKGTRIGEDYESDGIVPFMEMFNTTTASISQGGARKGALMMSLDIRHKEAPTFITIKSNADKITNANLSLELDDEFMEAVKKFYETGEKVVLHEKRYYGKHEVKYDIIPIELYKLMIQTVYDWGEPGCIFTGLFRNYNLMEFDPDYEIATCNPCGEQPLPRNFSCNLGSLNLSEFINSEYTDSAYFDHASFRKAVRIAVKALDTIIDENLDRHALKEQSENSKNYRNMGLGIFGYANALFKLGITYGSKKAKKFTDSIFKEMFITALETSNQLAKEKGMFPKCKPEQIIKSRIIQNLNDENLVESIKKFGLRNCSLISIAPTGSIATMLGCSGGCEPEFALSYTRHTVNLQDEYKVYCKSVQEYCKVNNTTAEFLPEYFVSSADIDWKDRVEVQGIMQKWVDTAISSTINLAEDTSISEVEQIYLYAWEQGLKGITIFRSGCKRIAILNAGDKKEEPTTANIGNKDDLPWGKVIGVNSDLIGIKTKLTNGCGSFHFQVFFDENTGRPWETFISLSDGAGCERNLEAISRLMSKCLRAGVPVEQIIDSLKAVRPCSSYCRRHDKCGDTSKGSSCPNSLGFALEAAINKIKLLKVIDENNIKDEEIKQVVQNKLEQKQPTDHGVKCPECGGNLVQEGGCNVCRECGYSKCG